MDAVQAAESGHPGTPMALAPAAWLLWTRHLKHDPSNPSWPDRDRFVLSCGHASMLLYGLLHLTGYDLPLEEIRHFRQWGSKTPGHPEHGHTTGVETTTGPLGQGVANAVGMAIAERLLAARFNQPDQSIVDHRVWGFCSDGDLMEGVASEAASLAGHLRLGKLTLIYDDNHITIEGSTGLAFGEDVGLRYEAYGFHVQRLDDGWTTDDLRAALDETYDGHRSFGERRLRAERDPGRGLAHLADDSQRPGLNVEQMTAVRARGAQRFGREESNLERALALFRGELRVRDPRHR